MICWGKEGKEVSRFSPCQRTGGRIRGDRRKVTREHKGAWVLVTERDSQFGQKPVLQGQHREVGEKTESQWAQPQGSHRTQPRVAGPSPLKMPQLPWQPPPS